MRYLLTLILVIYLASIPLFPRTGPGQTGDGNPFNLSGEFVLVDNTPLRVSIDTGWERNGNIPVFLVFNDLEVLLAANSENLSHAANAETWVGEMLTDDEGLSFVTYEKNPLRTRMELMEPHKPVKFHIIGEIGLVEFYIGDSRLKLDPLQVKLTAITPGELYELTFMGSCFRIRQHGKLVFAPSRGVIYNVSHGTLINDIPTEFGEETGWSEWAVRIEPGNENSLTNEI